MARAFAPRRATVGMVQAPVPAVRTRPPAAVKAALLEILLSIVIFRYRNVLVPTCFFTRLESLDW